MTFKHYCVIVHSHFSDSSVFYGYRPVRHGCQRWVVCDDNEGLVHLVTEAEEEFVQFLCRFGVEVARRLVSQHHCGLVDEGTRHSDTLLFTARKLGGLVGLSVGKV